MGAKFFHEDGRLDSWAGGRVDGQADMTKLIVALRNLRTRVVKEGRLTG